MISLEEVLSIKYPSSFEWSKDGKFIAFIWNSWGSSDLYLYKINKGELKRVNTSKGKIYFYHWNNKGDKIVYNKDNEIYYFDLSNETENKVISPTKPCRKPQWSPVTDELAFILEGNIWLFSKSEITQLTSSSNIIDFIWSPNGEKIAVFEKRGGKTLWKIYSVKDREPLWESEEGLNEYFVWISENSFLYSISNFDYIERKHLLVDLKADGQETIVIEKNKKGLGFPTKPVMSHDKKKALFVLPTTGWLKIWLKNLESGEFEQLTKGEGEDRGLEGDVPEWSPDDKLVAFSSNRGSKFERHIWTTTLDGELEKLVDLPGSNIYPKWSPDGNYLAFLHSGVREVPDIWILDMKNRELKRIINSAPDTFENKIIPPKIVEYEGAKGWKISASMFFPPNFNESKKYPAIVWLHGGPTRQMVRESWHPSRVYSLFYGLNQILAYNGYVVLFIDYRGSIGYGEEFKHGIYNEMGISDVLDVVKGAEYLGSLQYVDKSKIGVWGISYGGYLTLQALTKYPGVFRAGVNIAGVTNFESWMEWAEKDYIFAAAFFRPKLGGKPSKKNKRLYREASAVNFVESLEDKLLNLHGTGDTAVVFSQLDELIKELVKKGKEFEVTYYPEEEHAFENYETWADAFKRILKFFNENLKKE